MALRSRGFAPDDASGLRPTAAPEPAAKPVRERATPVAPSREGMAQFVFYVRPEARRQVRAWAALNGRTVQDIGQEMLNDWCRKQGLHRLTE